LFARHQEAITDSSFSDFLDHVFRQRPAEKLLSIKRNFYHTNQELKPLGRYLAVLKGTYSACRLSDVSVMLDIPPGAIS
jgi:hypothetical protein